MPNWVHNRLDIHCGDQRRSEIREHLKPPSDSDEYAPDDALTFQALIPRPAEMNDDWYNWNIANWDTKWDACEPHVEDNGNGKLRYTFNTAWSPPMAVIEAFATKNDDVDIEYQYEEEQGWGGNLTVSKGTLVKHDQYDIPDSHADLMERHGHCYCENGEQSYFDDCFYHQAKESGVEDPHILEAVKGLGSGWSGTLEELLHAAERL